jgi:hypothetical protein
MARSSGRYSKYPKVNRDIPAGGEPVEVPVEERLTADDIKALIAKSRRQSIPGIGESPSPESVLTHEEIADVVATTQSFTPEDVKLQHGDFLLERTEGGGPDTTSMSVAKVMEWVGDDALRAGWALELEHKSTKPRVTLLPQLEEVVFFE